MRQTLEHCLQTAFLQKDEMSQITLVQWDVVQLVQLVNYNPEGTQTVAKQNINHKYRFCSLGGVDLMLQCKTN